MIPPKKVEATPPRSVNFLTSPPLPPLSLPSLPPYLPFRSLPLPYLPLEVGLWGSAVVVSSPSGVWGRAPAEIDFFAF